MSGTHREHTKKQNKTNCAEEQKKKKKIRKVEVSQSNLINKRFLSKILRHCLTFQYLSCWCAKQSLTVRHGTQEGKKYFFFFLNFYFNFLNLRLRYIATPVKYKNRRPMSSHFILFEWLCVAAWWDWSADTTSTAACSYGSLNSILHSRRWRIQQQQTVWLRIPSAAAAAVLACDLFEWSRTTKTKN